MSSLLLFHQGVCWGWGAVRAGKDRESNKAQADLLGVWNMSIWVLHHKLAEEDLFPHPHGTCRLGRRLSMGTFSGGKKDMPSWTWLSRTAGRELWKSFPQSPHPSQTPATASPMLGTHCSPALEPITWRYIQRLSLKQVKERRITEITVTINFLDS